MEVSTEAGRIILAGETYGLPDDGAAYSIVKEKSPIVTGSAWLSMYGAAGSGHVPVPLIA